MRDCGAGDAEGRRGGDEDDGHVRVLRDHLLEGMGTPAVRQGVVEEDDVGAQGAHELGGAGEGAGVADDLEVGLGAQSATQALADERVVVDHQHADRPALVVAGHARPLRVAVHSSAPGGGDRSEPGDESAPIGPLVMSTGLGNLGHDAGDAASTSTHASKRRLACWARGVTKPACAILPGDSACGVALHVRNCLVHTY